MKSPEIDIPLEGLHDKCWRQLTSRPHQEHMNVPETTMVHSEPVYRDNHSEYQQNFHLSLIFCNIT